MIAAFLALSIIAAQPVVDPTPSDLPEEIKTIIRLSANFCYASTGAKGDAFEECLDGQVQALTEFQSVANTLDNAGQDISEPLTSCLQEGVIQGIAMDTRKVRDCFYERTGVLKGTF